MARVTGTTADINTVMKELKLLRGEVRKLSETFRAEAEAKAVAEDRLLTVKEAAKIINRSVDFVYRRILSGQLGTIRRGAHGNHRVSERELRRIFMLGS